MAARFFGSQLSFVFQLAKFFSACLARQKEKQPQGVYIGFIKGVFRTLSNIYRGDFSIIISAKRLHHIDV